MEIQWDSSTFKPGLLLPSVVEGTTWKCSRTAVHLNLDCCLLQLWRGTTWKCSGIAVHLNLDCCLLQLWRGLRGNAVG